MLYVSAKVEIGQLDSTIGVQEVPFGNVTYWFEGSSLYLTINLTQGMMYKPIGVFVDKSAPPAGPPAIQDNRVGPCNLQHQSCCHHMALCCYCLITFAIGFDEDFEGQ